MSFDWKSVVGTLAPTLATAMLGPLAGTAVAAIGKVFGLGDGANEQQVAEAMKNMTPDQALALKQEDNRFKEEMVQKGIDLQKLTVADRSSARRREEKTGDSATPKMLALAAVGFFLLNLLGTFLIILLKIKLDDVGSYLLGGSNTASVALLKEVYSYYFGSSTSSDQSNQLLYQSTPPSKFSVMKEDVTHAMPGIKIIKK